MHKSLTPKQNLLWILLPMLATVIGHRLYLHLVRVQHIYPAGYLVHHLFTGVLILIPAAFVLAFGTRTRNRALQARAALGIGSGMVLDEMTFLIMTHAADEDYVSDVSLWGAVIFVSLATILLLTLYGWQKERGSKPGGDKRDGKN